MTALLQIEDLRTTFFTGRGDVNAVDGLSLTIEAGQAVGLVGESGCGKSVTAMSIMRLVAKAAGRIAGGRILYRGQNLLDLPSETMRDIRGGEIAMIFQEPMTSLNPLLTIGYQIIEAIKLHQKVTDTRARAIALEMMERVGIPEPGLRLSAYPHQFSGGMRQRVMIAMALSCRPSLLLADEPTTALDVTIQAQILDLINELRRDFGMALLLITHDLGVVAEVADRVAVMYAGRLVEQGRPDDIFEQPRHPYTRGLLDSIPDIGASTSDGAALRAIPGSVPSPLDWPRGCRFSDRCDRADDRCRQVMPPLTPLAADRRVACHHPIMTGS